MGKKGEVGWREHGKNSGQKVRAPMPEHGRVRYTLAEECGMN